MYRHELRNHFFELTPLEKRRKKSATPIPSRFYQYLESIGRREESGVFHLPDSTFRIPYAGKIDSVWDKLDYSPHQDFFRIKRASRYLQEPFAYADFIAIRYVYSGEVSITTPTTSFTLHQNDLCLLNGGFTLSQHLQHDEDVVFTLMFEKEYLLHNIVKDMTGDDIITRFILNYIFESKNPDNYIIFHGNENDRLPSIIEDLLCEYIEPTPHGDILVESYLKMLLIEMTQCSLEYGNSSSYKQHVKLAELLNYIDHNYTTVSLEILSKEFGYNSKYLSRLIKQLTGKNFKDYVLEKRMAQVCIMLTNTTLSANQIMLQCGFANETYFYKKFREIYHLSPKEYREQNISTHPQN